MPLLDRFRPPLSTQRHWESFHTTWASAIADALNQRWLPVCLGSDQFVPLDLEAAYADACGRRKIG